MTVVLWILAILAVPTLIFFGWLAWVFLKEFFSPSHAEDAAAEAAEKLGLLPAGRQNTEYAGPLPAGWEAALSRVGGGDWHAAAELLRGIGRDWDRRSKAVGVLGKLAVEDDTWLLAWEAAHPDDPDAAVVRASSTITLAGQIRGAKRARHTTEEQFAGFHRMLHRSRDEIARAAALNPDDPTPYVTEISVALGLGYPHSEMDKLWTEITARPAPLRGALAGAPVLVQEVARIRAAGNGVRRTGRGEGTAGQPADRAPADRPLRAR